jgi:uncharacterized repeat protein (TIGR01451 family)
MGKLLGFVLSMCMSVAAFGQQADLVADLSGQHNATFCPAASNTCVPQLIPIAPGGQAIFALFLSNKGPATAMNVVATMTFPAKTVVHAASLEMSCSTSIVAGLPTVTCTLPVFPVGFSPLVFAQLDIAGDYASSTLVGNATVRAATADPVEANNSGTFTLPVTLPIPMMTLPVLGILGLALAVCAVVRL